MEVELKKSELTKRKIMQSAIKLFARKDYSSVGIREIAADAGVNLSLISYYFDTKENLYSTIINYICDLGLEFLADELLRAQEPDELTQIEKIKLYLHILYKYVDFLYSDKVSDNFVMLMLKEQSISNSTFGLEYRRKSQKMYNCLIGLLSSITGRKKTDSELTFLLCTTMGEILSFKFMKKIIYKNVERNSFNHDDNVKIKNLLKSLIKDSLKRLSIDISCLETSI